jgi:DNA binding domain, excisionase family
MESQKEKLMTKADVEDYLRISHMTLQNLMKNHKFPYIKLGKRVLFRKEDIDKYLEAHIVGGGKNVPEDMEK